MQTLALTFSDFPVPFGKGKFPPQSLKDLIDKIKKDIESGKSFLNGLKNEFKLPEDLQKNLDALDENLKKITENNFEGLKTSLTGLFANTSPAVANARSNLLNVLGKAQSAASQEFLGMPISQWSVLGNTLYEASQSFGNHVREISGTQTEDKVLTLQTIYGNTAIVNATVNINSTVAVANLSKSAYPIINVGETVVFNSVEKKVVGKSYTGTGQTVSFNSTTANTNLYSTNIATLNLANLVIGTGSLKLQPGMYINVASEIKQINTINALGDYLTVYSPFRTTSTSTELKVETGFFVNTAFAAAATDQEVKIKNEFIANSLCLSNVITGNGTTFTDTISVGDKVYYNEQEYFVLSVTNNQIVVDDVLRASAAPKRLFKVVKETAVMRVVESNSPEEILAMFDGLDQLSTSFDAPLTSGLVTKYRKSDGTYATVEAATPVQVTQSLQNGAKLTNAVTRTLQKMLNELQNDAIAALSESELVNYIEDITDELEERRRELMDAIEKDLAAINAVKGLLKGLLKLFQASCSKKKKGDDPEDPDDSSDQYLNLILSPNPLRQGCDATVSDVPEILDEADREYKEVIVPTPNVAYDAITVDGFDPDFNDVDYNYKPQLPAGGNGDITVDGDADLGAKPVDPCTQPC